MNKLMRFGVAAALVTVIAGCGGLSDIGTERPRSGSWFGSALTFGGSAGDYVAMRPVTSEDLVSADGQCALSDGMASAQATVGNASPADPNSSPAVGPGPARGGIALQMTECEVVSRAGPVEKIDVGANERNERAVTLTYLRGPWPGIYRFIDGRLTQVDRVTPPEEPKAKRKAPAKKKRA